MRRAVVAVLTAALVGVPAVPAFAVEGCKPGVEDVRGNQPTHAQVEAWIVAAAAEHQVPASLLRVIAYKESTWRQFTAATNAPPVLSNDGHCSIGLMQVTPLPEHDAVKLAADPAYNVMAGAAILRAKFDANQQATPPPDGYPADDPDVLENWYWALCAYNGCVKNGDGSYDDTYARDAAKYLHDPFRWLPASLRTYLTPAGFTRPDEADGTYVFAAAYQARWTDTGGEFVFYDASDGTVTKVVPARVHRVSAPPKVAYPSYSLGPDGPGVTCVQCSGWRLWEGAGISGRAHWTNTVTGTAQSKATWAFATAGRYRVDAYVPSLGTETLGTATYTLTDGTTTTTATVDQQARKGWVPLGTRSFASAPKVTLTDLSGVAGVKIVADAVRIVPAPTLTLRRLTPETTTYGSGVRLYMTLRYANGDPVRYRYVTLHRRPLGATGWLQQATLRTDANGAAELTLPAGRNEEFTARFAASGDYLVPAASGNVRVLVGPRITAAFSDNTVYSGVRTALRTTVTPAHGGQAVAFQWYSAGTWRTLANVRLDGYGRASWTFAMSNTSTPCGTYVRHAFRVYKTADYDHVATASPTAYLYVYRRC